MLDLHPSSNPPALVVAVGVESVVVEKDELISQQISISYIFMTVARSAKRNE